MKEIVNLKGFARIMNFMRPRMGAYLTGLIFSSSFNTAANMLMAFVLKDLVDAAAGKNLQLLYSALILAVIITVMLCMGYPIFEYIYQGSIRKTIADLRLKLFSNIETISYGHIENIHSGEVISRMNNDLDLLEKSYADDLRNVISVVLAGIGSIILMFTLDWKISSILLAFGAVTLIVNRLFAIPIRNIGKRIQEKVAIITTIMTDMFSGLQTVKILNLKRILMKRHESENTDLAKDTIKKAGITALLDGANFLMEWFNFGGCIVIGSIMVISGQTTFGKLIAIVQLLNGVTNMFSMLGNYISQLQISLVGAERVFELMDKEQEPERYSLPDTDITIKHNAEIVFSNVSFSYENGIKALDDISFCIQKGSTAALVGASGSGKSTIMKMLLGFYCPQGGNIAVSGKELKEYPLDLLRNLMAYVPQDSYLFNISIKENIRYGKPDATDDEIIQAAKMAFAHEFIMEQPDGYETLVGERGQSLSGGQKQRIAIARAFLKDAPILLLDEATSSLDSKSEELVKEALTKLMMGRTTITIAHRLSTIANADVIFEVDQGKLVEKPFAASLLG